MYQIILAALLVTLTLISGFADAQGFIHASHMWLNGKLIWPEVFKSALGFGLGIVTYWICVRFLQGFRIFSPEIQTITWFTVTIIGVAMVSGKFLHWRITDQIIGIIVLFGVAWLLIRASG
jgi:hypothetical protein